MGCRYHKIEFFHSPDIDHGIEYRNWMSQRSDPAGFTLEILWTTSSMAQRTEFVDERVKDGDWRWGGVFRMKM